MVLAQSQVTFAHSIGLDPPEPLLGEAFDIVISGEWPTNCVPPAADSIALSSDSDGIEVVNTEPVYVAACNSETAPYHVRLSSDLLAGMDLPAANSPVPMRFFSGSPGAARLLAFSVSEIVAGPNLLIVPRSGWWWGGSAFSGNGANMDNNGTTLVIGLFSFDQAGTPVWSLVTGPLTGRIFHGELDNFRDGQQWGLPADPEISIESMEQFHLFFFNACQARSWRAAQSDGMLTVTPMDLDYFFLTEPGCTPPAS